MKMMTMMDLKTSLMICLDEPSFSQALGNAIGAVVVVFFTLILGLIIFGRASIIDIICIIVIEIRRKKMLPFKGWAIVYGISSLTQIALILAYLVAIYT